MKTEHSDAVRCGVVLWPMMDPSSDHATMRKLWLLGLNQWQVAEISLAKARVQVLLGFGPIFDPVESAEDVGLYRLAWADGLPAAVRVLPVIPQMRRRVAVEGVFSRAWGR